MLDANLGLILSHLMYHSRYVYTSNDNQDLTEGVHESMQVKLASTVGIYDTVSQKVIWLCQPYRHRNRKWNIAF